MMFNFVTTPRVLFEVPRDGRKVVTRCPTKKKRDGAIGAVYAPDGRSSPRPDGLAKSIADAAPESFADGDSIAKDGDTNDGDANDITDALANVHTVDRRAQCQSYGSPNLWSDIATDADADVVPLAEPNDRGT